MSVHKGNQILVHKTYQVLRVHHVTSRQFSCMHPKLKMPEIFQELRLPINFNFLCSLRTQHHYQFICHVTNTSLRRQNIQLSQPISSALKCDKPSPGYRLQMGFVGTCFFPGSNWSPHLLASVKIKLQPPAIMQQTSARQCDSHCRQF